MEKMFDTRDINSDVDWKNVLSVPGFRHHCCGLDQKLSLMISVIGPRVCHVVQHITA